MNKLLKRVGLLVFVFFLAGGAFLYFNWKEEEEAIYVAMEQATLPVISMSLESGQVNTLHGYTKEMTLTAVRDVTTPLPEGRQLPVFIESYGEKIHEISYEIRSLDGSQLIERTTLEATVIQNGDFYVQLPIQNLILEDVEYSLKVILSTEHHQEIYYYSRIFLPKENHFNEMLEFAKDFSRKTFDDALAEDLVTFLETTPGKDNSSLASVDIKSNFANITWGDLNVIREVQPEVRITELTGSLASIKLVYQVYTEDQEGKREYYDITEGFSLKWTSQRVYLMAYERTMNQVFQADESRISGKKINLGIVQGENIETAFSPDRNHTAFVSRQALWGYNLKENKAIRIFTFADGTADKRAAYDQYGIKIISIDDSGNAEFMVYGYMNRDRHEGETGIAYYHYDAKDNSLEERFFIPSDRSYQMIRDDISHLTYVNENQMCYFLFGNSVYAVDLTGREYVVVAQQLENDGFVASEDSKRIAWKEGHRIAVMNLETGNKQTLESGSGESLKILGFVDDDFIYGLMNDEDINRTGGKQPMYAVQIISDDGVVQKRYEQAGLFITGVTVQDTRIRLERASISQTGDLIPTAEDTIIRNVEVERTENPGLQTERSGNKKLIYTIGLKDTIGSDKKFAISAPEKILKQEEDLNINLALALPAEPVFYAYSFGSLKGIYGSFYDAVDSIHDSMGTVTDSGQNVLWWRSTKAAGRTLAVPAVFAYRSDTPLLEQLQMAYYGSKVLDASGLTLSQALVFTSDGNLLVGYGGPSNILLIYGYDQFNIMYVDLTTGQPMKLGLNDSHALFETYGNQFFTILD